MHIQFQGVSCLSEIHLPIIILVFCRFYKTFLNKLIHEQGGGVHETSNLAIKITNESVDLVTNLRPFSKGAWTGVADPWLKWCRQFSGHITRRLIVELVVVKKWLTFRKSANIATFCTTKSATIDRLAICRENCPHFLVLFWVGKTSWPFGFNKFEREQREEAGLKRRTPRETWPAYCLPVRAPLDSFVIVLLMIVPFATFITANCSRNAMKSLFFKNQHARMSIAQGWLLQWENYFRNYSVVLYERK